MAELPNLLSDYKLPLHKVNALGADVYAHSFYRPIRAATQKHYAGQGCAPGQSARGYGASG